MNIARRRPVVRVIVTLFAIVGMLVSGSATAFADTAATPIAGNDPVVEPTTAPTEPEAVATTIPTPTAEQAVSAQDAPGTAMLTIFAWFCMGSTNDLSGNVYADVADAPDHTGDNCSHDFPASIGPLAVSVSDAATSTQFAAAPITNGVAAIQQIPAGDYVVVVSSSNFTSLNYPITIADNTTPAFDFQFFQDVTQANAMFRYNLSTCVDPDRAGDVEFMAEPVFAADTTVQCLPGLATGETGATITVLDSSNQPVTTVAVDPIGYGVIPNLPVGTYSLAISIDSQPAATSAPFDLLDMSNVQIIHYVASESAIPPTPDGGSDGKVTVTTVRCTDPSRAGDVDFQIVYDVSAGDATSLECVTSDVANFNLVLVNADNNVLTPISYYGPSTIAFTDLPQGEYRLRDTFTGAESAPFPVNGTDETYVQMRIFVDEGETFANLEVAVFTCLDPTRIGEADYTFQGDLVNFASTTNCQLNGDVPPAVTLTNTSTDAQYPVSFGALGQSLGFLTVPAGTYVASTAGYPDSAPFILDASMSLLGISLYVGDDMWTPAPGQQTASLNVSPMLCSGVTVQDGYKFIVVDLVDAAAAPTDTCNGSPTQLFSFAIIPVDDQGNEGTPIPLAFITLGVFNSPLVPSGTYVIREMISGNTSEPIVLTGSISALYLTGPYAPPTPTTIPTTAPGEPIPTATATAPAAATATSAAPVPTVTKVSGTSSGKVSALPNTGQGTSNTSDSLLLVLAALGSLMLLAAGISLRRGARRTR